MIARSSPDGYNLLAIANTFATVPTVMAAAGYDPIKDFAAVSLTCLVPQVLETSRSRGAQTFSVGGYASIETKGSMDSLLPSELAYDDALFEQLTPGAPFGVSSVLMAVAAIYAILKMSFGL